MKDDVEVKKKLRMVYDITEVWNELNNNSLPFLVVIVFHENDSFQTTVYRKPFTVSLPPHSNSS